MQDGGQRPSRGDTVVFLVVALPVATICYGFLFLSSLVSGLIAIAAATLAQVLFRTFRQR